VVPGTGSAADAASAKLLRRVPWAVLLFFGSILLFVAILYGQNRSREYQAATPTTATIKSCWKGRGGLTLRGHVEYSAPSNNTARSSVSTTC
jgi:hypothetical protein